MPATPRRCAVLGRPIAHSLSPVLHRAGYAAVGLDWAYDAHEVGEEDLARFLDGLDESWRGLSLTMPLKRSVVPLLDEVSEPVRQAQAANTVILDQGRRVGHNTDVAGVGRALRERYTDAVQTAVILGGGATAGSALLALADLGCAEVTLVVRDPARAADTVAAAGRHPTPPRVRVQGFGDRAEPVDVLVSTIPAAAQTAEVLARAEASHVVFEVLYHPWPTPLARSVSAGQVLVSGLDLLVHQACDQFRLMTGVEQAPLAEMRAAGERALRHGR